jgi:hypothetical protein
MLTCVPDKNGDVFLVVATKSATWAPHFGSPNLGVYKLFKA